MYRIIGEYVNLCVEKFGRYKGLTTDKFRVTVKRLGLFCGPARRSSKEKISIKCKLFHSVCVCVCT